MIARTSRTVLTRRTAASARALPAAALAAALLLTGCSGAGSGGEETAEPTAEETGADEAAQEATAEAEQSPSAQATSGALVEDFPSTIQQLPDSEIVLSSVEPADEGELVSASLTMRTESSEDDVLKFYSDTLGEADFAPVSDASSEGGVTTQAFHADNGNQLLSVSISTDQQDEGLLMVTIGGKTLP
ncbi:hypothetical protein [Brevibacterium album]|uniref:hypothetical protein n=1 Tax=Brevibacterium album TaxID=417948 RepID=UPI0004171D10|nr:hypothetical protein [Brevibacterium album]